MEMVGWEGKGKEGKQTGKKEMGRRKRKDKQGSGSTT